MSPAAPGAPRQPSWVAALAAVVVAAVALLVAWPVTGAGLTAPAAALRGDASLISDGVVTWVGWRPLSRLWVPLGPLAGHWLSAGLWVSLALAFLFTARRLGLSLAGAALAAILVAAHPLGASLHGDLAAQGVLVGLVGLLAGVLAGLCPSRGPVALAIGALAIGLGTLGHPIAALAPLLLVVAWRARREALWGRGLVVMGAVAAVGWVVSLVFGAGGGLEGPSGFAAALGLAGRALYLGASGSPLSRGPWELDLGGLSLTDPIVILGLAALIASVALASRARFAGVRVGAALVLLVSLTLAQPFGGLASAQPPGLVFGITMGLALGVGALVPRARGWLLLPVVAAGLALASLLAFERPAAWFADEASLSLHELSAVPGAVELRRRVVSDAATEGRLGDVLMLTEGQDDARLVLLRVRALLKVKRWSEASKLVRARSGPGREALECALADERREVSAERHCRAAIAEDPADILSHRSLARALNRLGRAGESEALLRALVERTGAARAWVALIEHFETFGWLQQALSAVDEGLAVHPGDASLTKRLKDVLLRKLRGDLLAKRYQRAIEAARRLLALDPDRDVLRYYLAEALAGAGDEAGARAERARAEAAGAKPPTAVDAMPGAPR